MDDEESIRMMARELLSHCGYEVMLTKDEEEALTLHQQAMDIHAPFHLVILDLRFNRPGKTWRHGNIGPVAPT